MSEIERMVRDLNSYLKNKNLIFELLDESKVDVWKVKNFNKSMMNDAGTAIVSSRIQKANQIKNYNNALVMDIEDQYEQKQLTYSGLSEMIKENRVGIAAALKMPMTKLFGLSAAGFNSGEDDIENYNAMVESDVRTPCRTVLRRILGLCFQQLYDFVPKFEFKFKPLRIMSEKEEEEIKTSRQNRIMSLYEHGLFYSQDVGKALQAYNLLTSESNLEKGLMDAQPTPPGSPANETLPGTQGTKTI
jgi:phage-related protein (TIGR01555 family)